MQDNRLKIFINSHNKNFVDIIDYLIDVNQNFHYINLNNIILPQIFNGSFKSIDLDNRKLFENNIKIKQFLRYKPGFVYKYAKIKVNSNGKTNINKNDFFNDLINILKEINKNQLKIENDLDNL